MISIYRRGENFIVERPWGAARSRSVVFTTYEAAKRFASKEGRRLDEPVLDKISVLEDYGVSAGDFQSQRSAPRFKLGDRVCRDDGSDCGEISFGPQHDELVGWKWKVQSDSGSRLWWNESSMVAERRGISMGAIREPGKFEGEQDYSEHFYEIGLDGGADHEWYTPNGLVDVFTVSAEDATAFPQLTEGERVAFLHEEQGFYTEIEPPTDEDLTHSWPGDDGDGVTLEEGRSGYVFYEGPHEVGRYEKLNDAVRAISRLLHDRDEDFFYYVDRKGGVHEMDRKGKIIWSW